MGSATLIFLPLPKPILKSNPIAEDPEQSIGSGPLNHVENGFRNQLSCSRRVAEPYLSFCVRISTNQWERMQPPPHIELSFKWVLQPTELLFPLSCWTPVPYEPLRTQIPKTHQRLPKKKKLPSITKLGSTTDLESSSPVERAVVRSNAGTAGRMITDRIHRRAYSNEK